MTYPTLEEVNNADREQLCRWHRFLPSPGLSAITNSNDGLALVWEMEIDILNKIMERLREMGGFTPELSKKIGWDPPKEEQNG